MDTITNILKDVRDGLTDVEEAAELPELHLNARVENALEEVFYSRLENLPKSA